MDLGQQIGDAGTGCAASALRGVCVSALVGLTAACGATAHASSACEALGFNTFPAGKSHKLYLYFPAADDASFEEFGVDGYQTSPARRFDVAELPSFTGTTADLRDAIADVVLDTFCEFNIEVIVTTTPPPASAPRRSTIAIGTDLALDNGGAVQYGAAKKVDTNDDEALDLARAWAGSYQKAAGLPGGELHGALSTLDRWARSIGGTVAHEAGHGYGLSHADGVVTGATEDPPEHHLMADGPSYTLEQRASYRRHFSDWEYTLLATTVGLSVQTMQRWQLTNPNMASASRLELYVLSPQATLTKASVYTGFDSPWDTPRVAALGPVTFRGKSYTQHRITWSTPKAWRNGPDGQVPGGTEFELGISFVSVDPDTPDPVIVTAVRLLDADGNPLALRPRVPGFDAGTLITDKAEFVITAYGQDEVPLQLENARLEFFARLVSIDALRTGAKRRFDTLRQVPVLPWRSKQVLPKPVPLTGRDVRLPIARLADGAPVVRVTGPRDCERELRPGPGRDARDCSVGTTTGLFPATATVVVVTVVEPRARQWDRFKKAYVTAPLRTTVHYQLVGRRFDPRGR